MRRKYYWKTSNGKIDVDNMSIEHLRNIVKNLVYQKEQETYEHIKSEKENASIMRKIK